MSETIKGRKFKNTSTGEVIHFVNPDYNDGYNLKVLVGDKWNNGKVTFSSDGGNPLMEIGEHSYLIDRISIVTPTVHPPHYDIIHTVHNGDKVDFDALG